ncbi:MAG TPA: chemotaxis protein CheB [Casimicrobiaceae bacterium]|nr:chemotaxis protein CheB [Casimicrobiaceae bacterium]
MPSNLTRDITVIGASAGGIVALRRLLSLLPADYPAAVFVVVHLAAESPSVLARILERASDMPVGHGVDGHKIRRGTVTVAAPDTHLLIEHDAIRTSHAARENHHRPSIDVLFRSAAVAFGPRVTGVILSGMLDDGVAGLWAIKKRGGIAVVQDPVEAEFPEMPQSALDIVDVDHSLTIEAIASQLVTLAQQTVTTSHEGTPPEMAREVSMVLKHDGTIDDLDRMAERTPFTCPECGGVLWEMDKGGVRYRCHVGHAYTAKTFSADQTTRVEAALWASLRGLEEKERLSLRLARKAAESGNERVAHNYHESARTCGAHIAVLKRILTEAAGDEAA